MKSEGEFRIKLPLEEKRLRLPTADLEAKSSVKLQCGLVSLDHGEANLPQSPQVPGGSNDGLELQSAYTLPSHLSIYVKSKNGRLVLLLDLPFADKCHHSH